MLMQQIECFCVIPDLLRWAMRLLIALSLGEIRPPKRNLSDLRSHKGDVGNPATNSKQREICLH